MSGPEPVLAATEALGCTSSSDSLVTLTFTPVALVKLATSSMKASSSAWMKRRQRSSDSCAPASGFHGAVCAHAFAHSVKPEPASGAGGSQGGRALQHAAAGECGHLRFPPLVRR